VYTLINVLSNFNLDKVDDIPPARLGNSLPNFWFNSKI